MIMPNIRGVLDDIRTAVAEDQGLASIVGAVAGAFVGAAVERFGPAPEPDSFAVTVGQARSSLMSALALVFTGLSIVLALTALTTGNMASKFSPRLLRMKLRGGGGNKWVLGVFAMTASFILTSQVLLRSNNSEDLAPPLTMAVSVILLVVTSVMIIWYINGTLQSLRVDLAIRWTGRRILKAIRAQERIARRDTVVPSLTVERPLDAADLLAPENGVLVSIDTDWLDQMADHLDCMVVIEKHIGQPVVCGESLGWASAPARGDAADFLECVTIARTRDPDRDVAYTISVLVDVGLMALSPAVNDPRTGVECAEVLTEVCSDLANRNIGMRTRQRSDGTPRVVVAGDTMGDHLDTAGRQLLLYGREDLTVTAALLRLGRQGERMAQSDRDRRLARAFADDVEAARASGTGSEGRGW